MLKLVNFAWDAAFCMWCNLQFETLNSTPLTEKFPLFCPFAHKTWTQCSLTSKKLLDFGICDSHGTIWNSTILRVFPFPYPVSGLVAFNPILSRKCHCFLKMLRIIILSKMPLFFKNVANHNSYQIIRKWPKLFPFPPTSITFDAMPSKRELTVTCIATIHR